MDGASERRRPWYWSEPLRDRWPRRAARLLAALGGAALLAAVAAGAPAGSASAASTPTTVTFASTAGCSDWSVPSGVTSIQAYTRGSKGEVDGGDGDAVSGTFTVSSNETLDVCLWVGRGTASSNGQTSDGGYGGGASGVALGATFSTPLLVAGAGGGGVGPAGAGGTGGQAGESHGSQGGAPVADSGGATGGGGGSTSVVPVGGGSSGAAGTDGAIGGVGGSTSSSGPGSGGYGGSGADGGDGGGGGGGYYGGGGGGTGNGAGAGGGGGSDYCDTALVSSCAYDSGAGYGIGIGTNGGNAEVTLTYYSATEPQAISFTSSPPAAPTVGGRYAVSATGGGSGNPVVFSIDGSSSARACSISGSTVVFTGQGRCQVDANQAAGNGYSAASQTDQSFTIAAAGPGVRPVSSSSPQISGVAKSGMTLSCSEGSWTGSPTGYGYQWAVDGTPIAGAATSTYRVQVADEGTRLTCTVTATNPAGSAAAASRGVLVTVPRVKGCPAATGTLSGSTVGLIRLGITRAQARRDYSHSSTRGFQDKDFFCLTPYGVRVGYGSAKLLKALPARQRSKYAGRIVWISTDNARYAIGGIRARATLTAAETKLPRGYLFRIGANDWYIAPAGAASAVLKVRDGIVQEIGIAAKPLTTSHKADRQLMTSFQ
jgi:hypothetical protein